MPESTPPKIALLLMAAGSSSRLGQPKQLIELTQAQQQPQSFLRRQVSLMNNICLSTNAKSYCVLGFQSEKFITHLANFPPAKDLTLIDNANWSQGLSSSIAKGVSALSNDVSAVLIFLVDQWQLTTENLSTLVCKWQQQPENIHIASADKRISPPVIFPRLYFNELTNLMGDDGAKKVIKNNMSQVVLSEMATAFVDLDTPEQLKLLNKVR
jgi:molybdenum cofactor cytidylyltransferase